MVRFLSALIAAAAAAAPAGKYCGKVGKVAKVKLDIKDASHADVDVKAMMVVHVDCKNEPFTLEADGTIAVPLQKGDCVYDSLKEKGLNPESLHMSYDASKDEAELKLGKLSATLTHANCGHAAELEAAADASHYEKPPCRSDEMQAQLQGGGELCAPKCESTGACPSDKPAGVTAHAVCALQDQSGDKYCGLLCSSDSQCDTKNGGKCSTVGFGQGVCTYDASTTATSAPLALSAEHAALWAQFKKQFNKFYATAEEEGQRLATFIENVARAAAYQEMDPGAQYSALTPYGDLHPDEFAARFAGLADAADADALPREETPLRGELPAAFDWREKGGVNAVQNQGQCGSCWAFATVANIESVNWRATGKLQKLSEQQLVDCEDAKHGGKDQGCGGGLPSNAYAWMKAQHTGLEAEEDYSYTGRSEACSQEQGKERVFIDGYKAISTDEDQIAQALMDHGVLSIGINAGPMQFYFGGIANPWNIFCNPKKLDHGVDIVGFGSDPKPYWIIRNSWGPSWGEKGYYRIVRGSGKCGLNTMVTTAVINKKEEEVVV